ncbi:hypothetical protein BCR34DRAFT_382268 [Clohesyomyces aquaticus]|uniref:Uncharacterized protein n=1 Tax=Clohesyomyces aquaticus TaxID=1231657 RepID=A0A1Y1ZFV9_9PLEO|nr:hypothetical protein BCR34DRAFT_382268 [Clohesyomyces aquaticus]
MANDLIFALSLPVIAAMRMAYKLLNNPTDVKGLQAPLFICEAFTILCPFLTAIFVYHRHQSKALIFGYTAWFISLPGCRFLPPFASPELLGLYEVLPPGFPLLWVAASLIAPVMVACKLLSTKLKRSRHERLRRVGNDLDIRWRSIVIMLFTTWTFLTNAPRIGVAWWRLYTRGLSGLGE